MNEALWRVQLSTGEIRMMTLEALDEAFDEGLIDARVPVLPPGESAWTTLGEAAGLDDEETPPEEAPSLSPIAISPPSSMSCVPDLDEPSPARLDLDVPEELVFAARSRRRAVFGAIAGVGALALALAVVAGKVGGSVPTTSNVNAAFAVEAPPPAAVEALPQPAPQPVKEQAASEQPAKEQQAAKEQPAKEQPAKEQQANAEEKAELSDWQKRMLLDADKAREDKARAKKAEKAERVEKAERQPKKPSTKTSQGLLNGGDRFDPLNGAL